MGLIDLFIVNDEAKTQEPVKVVSKLTTNKFPTEEVKTDSQPNNIFGNFSFGKTESSQTFPTTSNNVSQEHLTKALESYQSGFDSLNQQGYDFYEFYQAVISGGISNGQIYSMAFAMGNAMDKTMTKDKLLQQSDFYINEIGKVYADFVSKGNTKKQELVNQKNNENQSLMGDLNSMKAQLEALKIQITDRENKLSAIDSKYEPKISEIDGKLGANDLAKNTLIQSIEQVKQGIITNIK
jgi:hypothetical protein